MITILKIFYKNQQARKWLAIYGRAFAQRLCFGIAFVAAILIQFQPVYNLLI